MPDSGKSWANLYFFFLAASLAYLTVSFGLQVSQFQRLFQNQQLRYQISLPRSLVSPELRLPESAAVQPEMTVELHIPKLWPGMRAVWQLRFYERQRRRSVLFQVPLKRGSNRFQIPLRLTGFGSYQAPKLALKIQDLFGCYQIMFQNRQTLTLPVIPAEELPAGKSPRRPELRTQPFCSLLPVKEDLAAQREYHPGDDPRHINWKLFSRFGQLYTRVPETSQQQDTALQCHFLVDLSRFPSRIRSSVLERCVTAFLQELKRLRQQEDCQITVFLPGSGPNGLLYRSENEETLYQLLTDYPLRTGSCYREALEVLRRQPSRLPKWIFHNQRSKPAFFHPDRNITFYLFPEGPGPLTQPLQVSFFQALKQIPALFWLRSLLQHKPNPSPLPHSSDADFRTLLADLSAWRKYYRIPSAGRTERTSL